MALAQALTSNYTLSLLPCMLLLLANFLYISAWDVYELREFLLPFFLCYLGCLEQSVCSFIELEGFVPGISLCFSLSQWT